MVRVLVTPAACRGTSRRVCKFVMDHLPNNSFVVFGDGCVLRTHPSPKTTYQGLALISKRFLVRQGAGGAGLHTLAAKGAGRVAQLAIELGGDLGVKAPVHDADGVIAFLLGAHTHAAIAGDAQIIV